MKNLTITRLMIGAALLVGAVPSKNAVAQNPVGIDFFTQVRSVSNEKGRDRRR